MRLYVKTRKAIQDALTREPQRPRAYEQLRHAWNFEQIRDTVVVDGKDVPNPRKRTAVFVVHGMGSQKFTDTAIVFRDGIEDTIDALLKENPQADIPPPYTAEGFWANYDDFKSHFESEWKSYNDKERVFFEELWKSRTQSVLRTYFWFLGQLARLFVDKSLKLRRPQRVGYLIMFPIGVLAFTVLLLRYPRVLRHVLGDVRLYLAPRGFIEAAIVQRVDERVGEQFLELVGLDWDFKQLPPDKKLKIGKKPTTFKYVTWLAHSLGSVVSYNVISDLLTRCEEFKKKRKKLRAVEKVETALHRFITIGSPLEKVAILYDKALRDWPAETAGKFLQRDRRTWWTNFFHIWDPVSGILRHAMFHQHVENRHSNILKIPLLAHTAYWHDVPILKYVLSRMYGKSVVSSRLEFKTPGQMRLWQVASSIFVFGIYFYAIWYFVTHPEALVAIWRWGISIW